MSAATLNYDTYLRLGRISNLPTVWSNVLAGTALAGGAAAEQILLLALGASLLYTGGMYLNDAFDRHIDARERPERPIPAGRVSARQVFLLGYAMLAAGVLVIAVPSFAFRGGGGWSGVAAAVALAVCITVYDAWHKENPVSPVIMGLCRAFVYLTAALAVAGAAGAVVIFGGAPPGAAPTGAADVASAATAAAGPTVAGGAIVLLLYIVGLTYLAQQENLAQVRNWWPLLALAAPFVYMLPALADNVPAVVFYLIFLGWVVYTVALLRRREPLRIRRAVVGLIAGVSLLDALLIAGTGAYGLAVLAAFGLVLTLVLQRWAPGT